MSKSNLRIAIIVLTTITALVHLSLNLGPSGIQPAFLANAIGYIVLLVVFFKWINLPFLQGREKMVWYAFMGYTAVTIVAYFVVNGGASFSNPIGLFDKAVEVLLIVALWMHKES